MAPWSDNRPLSSDDPMLSSSEVSALLAMLSERSIDTSAMLDSAGVHPGMLSDADLRLSLTQVYRVMTAASAGRHDAPLLVPWATRLRLTGYGIVGYALLSCTNLAEALRVAERYAPLLHLKFSLRWRIDGTEAVLSLGEQYTMDDTMQHAFAVLELAKLYVLMRDIVGDTFKLSQASSASANPAEQAELARLLGVTVEGATPLRQLGELRFDAAWLTRNLPQAHPGTHAACAAICDQLMEGQVNCYDLVRHVKRILMNATGRAPTLNEVADMLCVSQRTLRRKLEALNTSYNQILEEIRKDLAIRYLTDTQFTTESIAELLGYSEAANFRHAFKRWTGTSPRFYRAACGQPSTANPRDDRRRRLPVTSDHRAMLEGASACWR